MDEKKVQREQTQNSEKCKGTKKGLCGKKGHFTHVFKLQWGQKARRKNVYRLIFKNSINIELN